MEESPALKKYPKSPGVYLMKNSKGDVLYVGKAKSLEARLKNYFQKGGDDRAQVPHLMKEVREIETIVVDHELEAFLLESNLIKKHQPKYNVLLKDDKSYLSLFISTSKSFPSIELVRRKNSKEKGKIFGPYASASSAREMLNLSQQLFPLRRCSDAEMKRRARPCLLYHMKRCLAPCVKHCTEEEYEEQVSRAVAFLSGQSESLIDEIRARIQQASDALEFERAKEWSEVLKRLESLRQTQSVDKPDYQESADVFVYCLKEGYSHFCVGVFIDGKLTHVEHHPMRSAIGEEEEVIPSFLLQYYEKKYQEIGAHLNPRKIFLSHSLSSMQLIRDALANYFLGSVELRIPQRGVAKSWVDLIEKNGNERLNQDLNAQNRDFSLLSDLQETLHLDHYPNWMECLDHSHLKGSSASVSCVAFIEGKPAKARYRRFNLKEAKSGDDYGAIKEALSRRLNRAKSEGTWPSLIVIDGGKGHLNAAKEVIDEVNLSSLELISISKERGRHDKGQTQEVIHTTKQAWPIELDLRDPLLHLLQRLRDEAHRFVITHHRQKRSKQLTRSILDDIQGIGPKKKKALIAHFGSLKRLKEASVEELEKLGVLNAIDIKRLQEVLDLKSLD